MKAELHYITPAGEKDHTIIVGDTTHDLFVNADAFRERNGLSIIENDMYLKLEENS